MRVSLHVPWLAALLWVAPALRPALRAQASPGSVAFYQGKLAFEEKRYRDAGQAFAAAGRSGYDPGRVHLWMGKTYIRLKRWEHAEGHLEKALAAGFGDDETRYHLATARHRLERLDDAVAALDAMGATWRRRPEVQLLLGEIAVTKMEYQRAFQHLHAAVKKYPYRVHSLSGYMPGDEQFALQEIAQARIAELEAEEAKAAAAPPPPPAPEPAAAAPPEEKPFIPGGFSGFGSAHAFKKKTGMGESYKMDRWGEHRGSGSGGPTVLKGRSYRGSSSSAN